MQPIKPSHDLDFDRDVTVPGASSVAAVQFKDVFIPQNPGLARNSFGSAHGDSHCSESVDLHGPCSPNLRVLGKFNEYGYTPVMVCNPSGQMIGVSKNLSAGGAHTLVAFDNNCDIINKFELDSQTSGSFAGGYFFLDNKGHTVVVSGNYVINFDTTHVQLNDGSNPDIPMRWKSHDLTTMSTHPELREHVPYSAMPVWSAEENLYWVLFAGHYQITGDPPSTTENTPCAIAVVKVVENASEANGCTTEIRAVQTFPHEWNNNTFAVDESGAYFVTNVVTPDTDDGGTFLHAAIGRVRKMEYDVNHGMTDPWNGPGEYSALGGIKVGLKNTGSGTTPTLMNDTQSQRRVVAITDNDEPRINVCVYDRDTGILVSKTPVFPEGKGAAEASLIGLDRTIVVENNFNHQQTYPLSQTEPIQPGFVRIDLEQGTDPASNGLVKWTDSDTSYLAMSILARKSGVIFGHTADWNVPDSSTKGAEYQISAIDMYNGQKIWSVGLGQGVTYAHDYGGVYFNQSNDLFVGTNNMLVSVQDKK